ncbi:hypothetical protein [Cupriavidus sp. D39]|uniref:hypothetical protein n=1 Tax=Cupriavidus sp. D39 TaxID=2997877 RepID=UPI00226E0E36|nr:hypothetical protein [Cupriavidus sp. D39]MCY0858641.1 hypothetical protein [Cupriavidus sp. D39]
MYNIVANAFKAAQESRREAYQLAHNIEMSRLPASDMDAIKVPLPLERERELFGFYKRLVTKMVAKASEQFAPPEAPLAIDETRLLLDGKHNVWDLIEMGREPDLDVLWGLLVQVYSQEGARVAYKQAAAVLVNAFGACETLPVKCTRGVAILRADLLSEVVDTATHTRRLLPAAAHEAGRLFLSLAAAAEIGGHQATAASLRQFQLSQSFVTPQRRTFPELDVVQFNTRWKFRLSHCLWDSVSGFLQEHSRSASAVE